ncbi:hypothetical protein TIFTF001_037236 [Ficus carica]|uniref:Uncharacterized protein n=1 Tax=Ficus carica TaxID=3494 RepID=A0AA88E4Y1_FICCA|nr:hypothetical protein TIFTF001_037221 [Ficus carica]GMN68165.1 hypothetical protein TIFTF001_037224 [Ficus carica]GMN68176.1 hypothetical protein TIFTF001_037233 [Ficus carica]GMN68177.1 hypothetical protein TIFTF001_037236 [Ficus carica]
MTGKPHLENGDKIIMPIFALMMRGKIKILKKAVSIVEADVVVDFALAKDYKKAGKPAAMEAMAEKVEDDDGLEKEESSFQAFTGKSFK